MKKQHSGNIVGQPSAAGNQRPYPVGFRRLRRWQSRAIGLVHSMATRVGRYGIRVNGLAPTHGMSINFALPLDAPVLNMSYEEFALQESGEAWHDDPLRWTTEGRPATKPEGTTPQSPPSWPRTTRPTCRVSLSRPATGATFAMTSIPFPKTWSLEEMAASALDEPAS